MSQYYISSLDSILSTVVWTLCTPSDLHIGYMFRTGHSTSPFEDFHLFCLNFVSMFVSRCQLYKYHHRRPHALQVVILVQKFKYIWPNLPFKYPFILLILLSLSDVLSLVTTLLNDTSQSLSIRYIFSFCSCRLKSTPLLWIYSLFSLMFIFIPHSPHSFLSFVTYYQYPHQILIIISGKN